MPELDFSARHMSGSESTFDSTLASPLQQNSRMNSARPPGSSIDLQAAANASHQVAQLRSLQPPGGAGADAPIQRTLVGEIKDLSSLPTPVSQEDQEAHNRYIRRKHQTQALVNATDASWAANEVQMLVYSGKIGLIKRFGINQRHTIPHTKLAHERENGHQHDAKSFDGEMYMIDRLDQIMDTYLKDYGKNCLLGVMSIRKMIFPDGNLTRRA